MGGNHFVGTDRYVDVIDSIDDNVIELSRTFVIKDIWTLKEKNCVFNRKELINKKFIDIFDRDIFLKVKMYISNEKKGKILPIALNSICYVDQITDCKKSYLLRIKPIKEIKLKNMSKADLFTALFENVKSGIAVYDVKNDGATSKDFIIKEYNPVSLKYAEKRKTEVLGKSIYDIVKDVDNTALIEVMRRVYKTGISEKLSATKFENKYWFDNSIFKLPTGEIVASYIDVTDVMESNESLKESQEKLSVYIDKAPYGVILATNQGDYLASNQKTNDITGYSDEELKKLGIFGVIPVAKHDVIKDVISKIEKDGEATKLGQFIHKNGGIRDWSLKAIKFSDNKFLVYVEDITEKINLEKSLIDSEQRFKNLFEKAPLGYQSLNKDGYISEINMAWIELLGYKKDEIVGKWFGDFLTEKGKNDFATNFPIFKKNGSISTVLNMISKNGNSKFIRFDGRIGIGKDGKFEKTHCILKDVTDEIKIEKAIKENAEILKTTESIAHVGSFKHFIKTSTAIWSDEFYRILGYEPNEIFADVDFFISLISKKERKNFEKNYYQMIKKKGRFESELKITRKDKQERWILLRATIEEDYIGETNQIYGSIIDIHERKTTEENLLSKLRILGKAEKVANIGYFERNWETKEYFWSDGMHNIFDIDSEHEIQPKEMLKHTHPEDQLRLKENIEKSLIDKKQIDIECRIITSTGKTKFIHGFANNYYNNKGKPFKTLGVISDVTEKVAMEEEKFKIEAILREQQKLEAIGVLASGVAHEINNPINGVMNYGQIIIDRSKDEKITEYAREIVNESNRISDIVKNLLQFSRQDKHSFHKTNMHDVIIKSVTLIRAMVRHDHITLVEIIDDNLPSLQCRSQQIQQVVLNLLTNARDAVNSKDDNKRILVLCKVVKKEDNNWIRVAIVDNGPGVSEDVKDKIFNPFFTLKPKGLGTGLGLSISYGIIKEHNGNMGFLKNTDGNTEFYFELPIVE